MRAHAHTLPLSPPLLFSSITLLTFVARRSVTMSLHTDRDELGRVVSPSLLAIHDLMFTVKSGQGHMKHLKAVFVPNPDVNTFPPGTYDTAIKRPPPHAKLTDGTKPRLSAQTYKEWRDNIFHNLVQARVKYGLVEFYVTGYSTAPIGSPPDVVGSLEHFVPYDINSLRPFLPDTPVEDMYTLTTADLVEQRSIVTSSGVAFAWHGVDPRVVLKHARTQARLRTAGDGDDDTDNGASESALAAAPAAAAPVPAKKSRSRSRRARTTSTPEPPPDSDGFFRTQTLAIQVMVDSAYAPAPTTKCTTYPPLVVTGTPVYDHFAAQEGTGIDVTVDTTFARSEYTGVFPVTFMPSLVDCEDLVNFLVPGKAPRDIPMPAALCSALIKLVLVHGNLTAMVTEAFPRYMARVSAVLTTESREGVRDAYLADAAAQHDHQSDMAIMQYAITLVDMLVQTNSPLLASASTLFAFASAVSKVCHLRLARLPSQSTYQLTCGITGATIGPGDAYFAITGRIKVHKDEKKAMDLVNIRDREVTLFVRNAFEARNLGEPLPVASPVAEVGASFFDDFAPSHAAQSQRARKRGKKNTQTRVEEEEGEKEEEEEEKNDRENEEEEEEEDEKQSTSRVRSVTAGETVKAGKRLNKAKRREVREEKESRRAARKEDKRARRGEPKTREHSTRGDDEEEEEEEEGEKPLSNTPSSPLPTLADSPLTPIKVSRKRRRRPSNGIDEAPASPSVAKRARVERVANAAIEDLVAFADGAVHDVMYGATPVAIRTAGVFRAMALLARATVQQGHSAAISAKETREMYDLVKEFLCIKSPSEFLAWVRAASGARQTFLRACLDIISATLVTATGATAVQTSAAPRTDAPSTIPSWGSSFDDLLRMAETVLAPEVPVIRFAPHIHAWESLCKLAVARGTTGSVFADVSTLTGLPDAELLREVRSRFEAAAGTGHAILLNAYVIMFSALFGVSIVE